jgi:hypothetical protein
MHDTSSWHKLCLWTEHSWHDFHYLQLLVDYLSLHLEHSALERASSAPTAKSTIQGIWWAILDSKTKIKWMTFTILVPEYLIGKTIGEKLAAIAGVKLMKSALVCPNETTVEQKKQIADVVYSLQWQEIHAYMANMGYFVVDFSHVLDNLNNQQGRSRNR